jgi:hypothetical protein
MQEIIGNMCVKMRFPRKVGVLTDYSRQKALAKASAFCNEAAPDGADEAMNMGETGEQGGFTS